MNKRLQRAFEELETLYQSLETDDKQCRACGRCCWFEFSGHRLFATRLEALYLAAKCGPPPRPFTGRRCGYQHGRICGAREGRVLGCRTYFCEAAGGFSAVKHESALSAIKAISAAAGVPVMYRDLAEHFAGARVVDKPEIP